MLLFALYISLLHIFHSSSLLNWFVRCCCCCCWYLMFSSVFISKFCYFVYYLFFLSLTLSLSMDRNQFLVYFRMLYTEDAFVCVHAFNLYLRSLSMRCYAHLSLLLFLSLGFMRFASLSMHHIVKTTMHHTHIDTRTNSEKAFLIYKLCIMLLLLLFCLAFENCSMAEEQRSC